MKQLFFAFIISFFFAACGGEASDSKTETSDKVAEKKTETEEKTDPKPDEKTDEKAEILSPLETVRAFVSELGDKNFEAAFARQSVKKWGDFKQFSSLKAFGGIWSTDIIDIEERPAQGGKAVVFAKVSYKDEVNGDDVFEQNFYLEKKAGKWTITDMKLVKNKAK